MPLIKGIQTSCGRPHKRQHSLTHDSVNTTRADPVVSNVHAMGYVNDLDTDGPLTSEAAFEHLDSPRLDRLRHAKLDEQTTPQPRNSPAPQYGLTRPQSSEGSRPPGSAFTFAPFLDSKIRIRMGTPQPIDRQTQLEQSNQDNRPKPSSEDARDSHSSVQVAGKHR